MRTVIRAMAFIAILQGGDLLQAQALPLPPVESVLERLITNAPAEVRNDRHFRRQYHYVQTRTESESNAHGDERSQTTTLTTNAPKSQVSAAANPKKPSRKTSKAPRDGGDKRSVPIDKELLSHFDFQLEARERLRDRDSLKLTFSPRPNPGGKNDMSAKFLRQIAGTVWVDEADGFIAKLELHLLGPIDIAGGIAGSIKNLKFESERERTPEGVWFTRSSKGTIDTRQLFSRKIILFSEQISDPTHADPQSAAQTWPSPTETKN